jgi:hypothetical protein
MLRYRLIYCYDSARQLKIFGLWQIFVFRFSLVLYYRLKSNNIDY